MPISTLAEVAFTFTLTAIDTSLGPTLANTILTHTNTMLNGAEVPTWAEQSIATGINPASPRWAPISAELFNQFNDFMDGWGKPRFVAMGLISETAGPTKKRLGDITLLFKVILNNTSLPPTESNITILETRTMINGVLFPSWAYQNTTPYNPAAPKWAPISLAAKNELTAFISMWFPDWLLAQGITSE